MSEFFERTVAGILGIGVDSIEIARVERALRRRGDRFARRVLTVAEQAEWARRGGGVSFLAGRWAAKEAVSKALGCGIGKSLGWRDVEIFADESGRPKVVLSTEAGHRFSRRGEIKILISITHSRTLATAAALAMG